MESDSLGSNPHSATSGSNTLSASFQLSPCLSFIPRKREIINKLSHRIMVKCYQLNIKQLATGTQYTIIIHDPTKTHNANYTICVN